ncbi:MAG: flagellar basal body P-ring protein FlgI [Proteobacteria bacterium]|nr:flagellar basal body P-ring protein FlgI [Pseudomonadota bacterium]
MRKLVLIIALLLTLGIAELGQCARLKDIADVEGVRGNQLLGYGIVVGLNGTGDGKIDFTLKSMSNMLEKMGIRTDPILIKVKNVASVMVTSELPPFARPGSKVNITVSSMGDAKSLQGGILLITPLKGGDGNTYAVAQGPIDLGGFAVSGGGDSAQKNHPTVGTIPQGALVERAIPFDLFQSNKIRIVLRTPDFTTMTRVVAALNRRIGKPAAVAIDSAAVEVPIDVEARVNPVGLIAALEQVEIEQDLGARIIVNERTGTIIMGEKVTINKVALAHGNLNISIRTENQVVQPNALAGGQTAQVSNVDINVGEEVESLRIVGGEVTLGDLVKALNAIGATPRDLIAIFTALKAAGALNAELVVM